MYAGLTIANKPALLDAKARGAEWVARDASGIVCGYKTKPVKVERDREWYTDDGFVLDMHKGMKFVKWGDPDPVNIDLALVQIAEMESKEKPMFEGYDVEQLLTISAIMREAKITPHDLRKCIDNFKFAAEIVSANIQKSMDRAFEEQTRKILNSPYTEGAANSAAEVEK